MLAGSTLSTAVLALILGGAGLLFSIVNFVVAARNRRQDEEDKKDQRAAEQSYKYSKEVQHILIEVERYKRQVCGDSDGTYYQRLKECLHEKDWEVKSKLTVVHGFWRETIFLWKKVLMYLEMICRQSRRLDFVQGKLPNEFFEKQNIWLHRGNMYRLLVERADIANHYGLRSMSGAGHYLDGNRPGRYEFFEEMWTHRKGKTPRSSVEFALLEQKLDPTGRMLQSFKNLMYTEMSVNTELGLPAVIRNPRLQKESIDGKLAEMGSAV